MTKAPQIETPHGGARQRGLHHGSASTWSRACTGCNYVGDKLGVLARVASWLADGNLFVANFDARSVHRTDGTPAVTDDNYVWV
jgi:hypothetical protein